MFVIQGDTDRLVSVSETRKWVDKMKELKMNRRYVEVKNGSHVFMAFQYFDEIFSFYAANPKEGDVVQERSKEPFSHPPNLFSYCQPNQINLWSTEERSNVCTRD